MSPLRRAASVALSVLVALAAVPVGSALALGPALSAQCTGDWQSVGFSANLAGMEPQAVAALGGEPEWLVGLASAVANNRRPMLATWTGTGWQRVPGPWSAYGILTGVAATSAGNAWTVGSTGSYERWPISGRWNGSSWSSVAVPRPAAQLAVFADLALIKGQKLWAAGSQLIDGRAKPLVMKHVASGWSTHDPSISTGAEAGLADVTRAPGGRVWAAGWKSDDSGEGRAWVAFRNGGTWKTSALDTIPGGRASITDLTFRTAKSGWAAGFVETIHGYQPILQRWNGKKWKNQAVPWAAGRSILLNAVEVAPDGHVAVAGMEVEQLRRDVLATLTGSAWDVLTLSPGTIEISIMSDLARLSSGFVAAGAIDRQPISLLPCAGAPAATPIPGTLPPAHDQINAAPEHDHDAEADLAAARDPSVTAPAAVSIPGTVAVDRTAGAGLNMSMPTWSGVVADFNDDDHDDLFISRHWEFQPRLMLGSAGGGFTTADGEYGLVDRHKCVAADLDASGSMDLFCAIGANKGTTNTPNELLLDVSDGGGTWSSADFGLMDGFGRARDVAVIDIDGDPYPDLFVTNEPSRADAMWSSNRLYRNLNGQGFRPAPEYGLDHSVGYGFAFATDIDGDGDDDLMLRVTEPGDGLEPGARVYLRQGGQFVDRTAQLNLQMPLAVDMEVADFNGDGKLDVAQLAGQSLRVSLRAGSTFAQSFQLDVAAGIAMAVGDVDGDGRPDIYIAQRTSGNSDHLMLVNRSGGTEFVSMTIPQPGAGRADDVLAIDYDGNGRTDFVTLNGWSDNNGPVKLTAFEEAP